MWYQNNVGYIPAVMLGLAVGDSLGAPFEQPASATEPSKLLKGWDGEYLEGHGLHTSRKKGEWTDDTGMAVALAEALVSSKSFNTEAVSEKYHAWYCATPRTLIGGTILKAMGHYGAHGDEDLCGVEGSEGNGSAMRCAPIGLFHRVDTKLAMDVARLDARITHKSLEAEEGSAAVAGMVSRAFFNGYAKNSGRTHDFLPEVTSLLRPSKIRDLLGSIPKITNSLDIDAGHLQEFLAKNGTKGHVLQTVPAAIACFVLTNSFAEAVKAAIRAGGDTDTTAAITGAIAGAYYGLFHIPFAWRKGVDRGTYLVDLDEALMQLPPPPKMSDYLLACGW